MKTEQPQPVIETPCNGDCVIDPDTGYCEGCQRTTTEIAKWTAYTPEQRQSVMDLLPLRKQGLLGEADD